MNFRVTSLKLFVLFSLIVFWFAKAVLATDYSSTNFKVVDPSLNAGGAVSGTSFGLGQSFSQSAIGKSSSSSFQLLSGFQYYYKATPNVLTLTPGDAQISLSWTVPQTYLGITVCGYEVGTGTSSGSYTYQNVGNVTSFIKTGLSNGTRYYFKVRALSPGDQFLVSSNESSDIPVATSGGSGGSGSGSGSGSGGGSFPSPPPPAIGSATVFFTGRAYPGSTVTLLKDAQIVASTIAGTDANFSINLSGISSGTFIFSLYGEDKDAQRSSLLSFPVSVTSGTTTNIGGIFIAPTIDVDKSQVKKGDNIAIFGQSVPNSEIIILVHSNEEFSSKVKADSAGIYLHNFDTSVLDIGDHTTKSKASIATEISSYGKAASFSVGSTTILKEPVNKCTGSDENCDGKVNLIDFSIVAYWYGRSTPPAKADLNNDGVVNLVDLSILAFHWTG
jgi:hypothetical protein